MTRLTRRRQRSAIATPARMAFARAALACAALAGTAFIAAGCAGRSDPEFWIQGKRVQNIRRAAEQYGNDLRWGRITEAAARVHADDRSAFLARFLHGKPGLEFTSFELISVEQPEASDRAEVHVVFEYFRPPSIQERHLQELQQWVFDSGAGVWRVHPQLDLFAEPGSRDVSGR